MKKSNPGADAPATESAARNPGSGGHALGAGEPSGAGGQPLALILSAAPPAVRPCPWPWAFGRPGGRLDRPGRGRGQLCRISSILGASGLPGASGRGGGRAVVHRILCRNRAQEAELVPSGSMWRHNRGPGAGLSPGPGRRRPSGLCGLLLRVACAAGSAAVFRQVQTQRGTLADACAGAMLVLGLCQVVWFRVFGCRLGRGGLSHLYGNRDGGAPGAVLCGLAVDLSRITPVPVTPVLCVGFLCRSLLARRSRFLSVLCPALWSLPVMYVAGTFDPCVLLGLGTGGLVAGLFPGQARPDASAPAPLLTGDCQPFGDCRWSAGIPSGNPEPGAPQCGRARHCHLI